MILILAGATRVKGLLVAAIFLVSYMEQLGFRVLATLITILTRTCLFESIFNWLSDSSSDDQKTARFIW